MRHVIKVLMAGAIMVLAVAALSSTGDSLQKIFEESSYASE